VVTTDRSTLKTIKIDTLIDKWSAHHSFMASQQSKFLNEPKSIIKPGEYVVLGNFAEKYSFILKGRA
jgi:hypothetical protein